MFIFLSLLAELSLCWDFAFYDTCFLFAYIHWFVSILTTIDRPIWMFVMCVWNKSTSLPECNLEADLYNIIFVCEFVEGTSRVHGFSFWDFWLVYGGLFLFMTMVGLYVPKNAQLAFQLPFFATEMRLWTMLIMVFTVRVWIMTFLPHISASLLLMF